jgi:membrane protease YdiL (CAAX protease family)
MKKWKFRLQRVEPSQLDERILLYNVYITQILTFLLGLGLVWLQGRNIVELWRIPADSVVWLSAVGFGILTVGIEALLSRWLPKEAFDDGGINELLFGRRSLVSIALISLLAAVSEELLFRGAVQYWLGPYWTSILFALAHIRYLRHWFPTAVVFLVSYGLGWLMEQTGSLWAAVTAHFVINLISGMIIRYRRKGHVE